MAITGGVSPVTYQWSHHPDFQGDILTDLPAGNYTVTATDAHNCKAEVSFILVDPALPEVSLDPVLPVVAGATPFSLSGGLPLGGVYAGEGVVEGIFDPSIGPGTYEITYTYTDLETECTNTAVQTITVKPDVLRVTGFTLVNADTHEDLFDLTEGMQINVNTLPTLNLDVRANTTNDVESVRISVSGKLTASRTENIVPYALIGDLPAGNYFGNPFSVGAYTVTPDPFAADALKGEKGTSLSINFELVDENLLDNKRSNPLVISPNAASVEATISFRQPVNLMALQVYDLQGRLIKNIPLKSGDTVPNYTLDVQDLAPGSYFVKSQDVHGKVFQKQILINR